MHLQQAFRRWQQHFMAGPGWIILPAWMRERAGYRSPTLISIAWLLAWYLRLFTIPGRMMFGTTLLISFYCLTMKTPVRILGFSLVGIFIVDFITGFFLRPKLIIRRRLPERARAGSIIKFSYQIVNRRKIPALNIFLDTIHAHPLMHLATSPASVDTLASGASHELHSWLKTGRRGVYRIPCPIAASTFPFGLVRWSCRSGEKQTTLVYPAFEPLQNLTLPLSLRYQREIGAMLTKVGESMEFHGCREFRTGDNPKHIHWPSSARHGELVVREFQEEFLCRIALITDTHPPGGRNWKHVFKTESERSSPAFEAALSLTAAIADHLAKADHVIDLFAAGPEIYHFKTGRGLARFEQLLDILACIEPDYNEPISRLSPTIMEELIEIGAAVLILLNWDSARAQLVKQLKDHSISVKIILVCEDMPPGNMPQELIHLPAASILAGEISQL